jgi:hypothetical protein
MDHTQTGPRGNPDTPIEWRLAAAGWRRQGELASAADEWGLGFNDFTDPVSGHLCGYLRIAHDMGLTPRLAEAVEYVARRCSISTAWADREAYERLQVSRAPDGPTSITDLVKTVTEAADDRRNADLQLYFRETWRAVERVRSQLRTGNNPAWREDCGKAPQNRSADRRIVRGPLHRAEAYV